MLWRLHISHQHVSCKRREGFRPGTVALRKIQQYQKSTELLIRRAPFQWVIYEIMWGIRNDLRIQAVAIKGLQGSSRGLFCRLIWRLQPVWYPCKMSHHHAKRCAAHKKNMWREDLEISWPVTKTWSFSGPPTFFKSRYKLEKLSKCLQH